MKIRTGFVSNSSSSSFLIWGVIVDSCTFEEAGAFENGKDDDSAYEFAYANDGIVHTAYDYNDFYCGRCPSECRDDETMGAFKERVETEVKTLLDKHKVEYTNLKFNWLAEAWHD